MVWELRRAKPVDCEAIMLIESTTFGSDAWSSEAMAAELAGPHTYYLVAMEEGRVDGYAGLLAAQGSPQADIQTIAVASTARRQGLGRVLMLSLITEARQRGALEVFLEVRADNPSAKNLYDDLGFEAIAVRPRYYQPDNVDAIVMRLNVEPTETMTT